MLFNNLQRHNPSHNVSESNTQETFFIVDIPRKISMFKIIKPIAKLSGFNVYMWR